MRAAMITEYGTAPSVGERPDPVAGPGQAVVKLCAAALNPADIAVASGTFPAGSPPLPYVPGIEGVGVVVESQRLAPGTRVWASGRGIGVTLDGTLSERFLAPDDVLVEVPEAADDVTAAAIGVAGLAGWLPVSWRAPVREGDSVLVLGATGNVGLVAVQAARILGASRVVAVGRDAARLERAAALAADAVVALGDDFKADLAEAVEGAAPTLVVDALWGPPLEATLAVVAPGARIVHLGQSAGPTATLVSGFVRSKMLEILGYTNFAVPQDVVAQAYVDLVEHVAAGRVSIETETASLAGIGEAWAAQAASPDAKLVVLGDLL